MKNSLLSRCLAAGIFLAGANLASLHAQTILYGLTTTNSLVVFGDTGGAVSPARLLTGAGVGETVVGLDFRPFNGQLYAVTRDAADAGRLYTVNPASGAMTAVALSGAALTLTGSVGLDFNPAAVTGTNALRIVTSDEHNYRLVFSAAGATVNVDTSLNVAGGAAGTNVIATAYSNNRAGLPGGGGAGGTTQYTLDADTDQLYRVNPPNGGVLTNGLPLGVNAGAAGGLDILTGGDRALAILNVAGSNALYEINLATGAATLLRGLPPEIVNLSAPTPPAVTQITRGAGTATLDWSGGTGPFAVQKANLVNEPFCGIMTLTGRTATVSTDGRQGFLRVADLGSAPLIPLSASLSGAAERPTPVTTTGNGFATLELNGDTLSFDLAYRSLSAAMTAAHIHGPATSSGIAGVLVDLAPFHVGAFGTSGNIIGSVKLTSSQKASLLGGQTYLNIHTSLNPGGEIRGQIAPIVYKTALSGEGERATPVTTPAIGFGTLTLLGQELAFNITYTGLKTVASAMHIHGAAAASGTAGVMVDLLPFHVGTPGVSGAIVGKVTLTAAQLAAVADGLTYVNIHTPSHAGGEVRGQIHPLLTGSPFGAELTGAAERPAPVTTPGTGFAALTVFNDRLHVEIRYRGMTSAVTAAHLHGPAPASSFAGVLIDLLPLHRGPLGTSGVFYGSVPLTAAQRTALFSGASYVNIHTVNNPGGEVRGQAVPIVLQSTLNGAAERPAPVVTAGTGYGRLTVLGKQCSIGARYFGLGTTATLAHLHGPATAAGTAGVLVNLAPYNAGGFGVSGLFLGTFPLTDAQLAAVVDGLTYLNVHTTGNGGGEIRGQVVP